MTRLERKCFVGSASFHGLLLLIFLFASAFLNAPKKQQTVSVVTIFSTPTDRMISTGGSPKGTPTPPAPAPAVQPQPVAPTPPPPQPEKKPEPVKPEPVKPQPVVKQPDPEPVKQQKVAKKPPIHEVKDPVKSRADFAAKQPNKKIEKPKDPPKDTDSDSLPKISKKVVVRTNDVARLAQERAERERRERIAREQREYSAKLEAYNRQQAAISSQVNGVVSGVGKDLGKATVIDALGDGSPAVAHWGSLVKDIFDRAWVEPPSLVDDDGTVKVRVTVARNGRVVSTELVRRSGIVALDKSVDKAIKSVRVVPPFPPESTDAERTFDINFNLKAKRMST